MQQVEDPYGGSMSLKTLKIRVKNRENSFYSLLHDLYNGTKCFHVKYPNFIAAGLYHERQFRHLYWNNLKRLFYYEPIFRSRCNKVGRNLYLIEGIPYISQGLEINIGDSCTIYGTSNMELVDIRNKGVLNIGNNTSIGFGNVISVSARIDIGNHVILAPGVRIRDNDGHPLDPVKRRHNDGMAPESIRPVTIEDDVWICAFAMINKGVTIGRGAVIGAGSVVTKDIPPFCIAAGNPAKVIKEIPIP